MVHLIWDHLTTNDKPFKVFRVTIHRSYFDLWISLTLVQGVIELILATDMARHGEFMDRYKQCLATGFDSKNEEHLQTVSWRNFRPNLTRSICVHTEKRWGYLWDKPSLKDFFSYWKDFSWQSVYFAGLTIVSVTVCTCSKLGLVCYISCVSNTFRKFFPQHLLQNLV